MATVETLSAITAHITAANMCLWMRSYIKTVTAAAVAKTSTKLANKFNKFI